MKNIKRFLCFILTFIIVFSLTVSSVFAHSGETHSKHEHKDNNHTHDVYHYCDGTPPHLHQNGICPYQSSCNTSSQACDTSSSNSCTASNPDCTYPAAKRDICADSIKINEKPAKLNICDVVNLSATISPADVTDASIFWTSSDDKIAAINQNGELKALSAGIAEITAANGECKSSIFIEVLPAAVTNVEISDIPKTVKAGDKFCLTAHVYPCDDICRNVRWETSDDSIATIDEYGNVSAKSKGEVTFTAYCSDEDVCDTVCINIERGSIKYYISCFFNKNNCKSNDKC